jgi:hemerythrin-like domain-containing protein
MATKKKSSSQSRSKQNSRSRNGANGRSASGNGRSRSGTRSKDVIALLKEDHANVRELLGKLVEGRSRAQKSRQQLFTEIEMELELHARVEEEIVYPAFLEIVERSDRHMFFEAREEHALVRRVMDEMDAGSSEDEEFAARAKVLKDLVEHHAKEEEREMFPLLKSETEPERLREMGAEIEARKQELRPEFEGRYQHAR